MSSYKAVTFSEFDITKMEFGKPKKQNQGSVVNILYNQRNFVMQTPLMNTFGLSQYENKWTLSLSFNTNNPTSEQEVGTFKKCIDEIEEKLITELTNGLYREWLGIGDKWDKFSLEMKRELISQKCEKRLLKHSKKDVEKKYAPTMNIKLNKKKDSEDFYVNTFMMDDENRIILNEKGEYVEYDIKEKLYFEQTEEKKIKPRIYCLFSMSIWLISGNIYLTPVCNQVLIQPVKMMSTRVTFNEKGFMKLEDTKMSLEGDAEGNEEEEEEDQQEYDEDDDEMPARA